MNPSLHESVIALQLLPPKEQTVTITGSSVNVRNRGPFQSCLIIFDVGEWSAGTFSPQVLHSDDGVNFEEVGDLVGQLQIVSSANEDLWPYAVAYMGGKKYLRAKIVVAGEGASCFMGAMALLGDSQVRPIAIPVREPEA